MTCQQESWTNTSQVNIILIISSSVTIFICGGTWGANQKVEQPNIIAKKCGVEILGKRIKNAVTEFLLTIAKIETKKLTGTED